VSKEAKYIVVKMRTGIGGSWEDHIIVFGSNLIHKAMAEPYSPRKVVGAGFIRFTDKGPYCYGKSESLGVESRPVDTVLAKIAFGENI